MNQQMFTFQELLLAGLEALEVPEDEHCQYFIYATSAFAKTILEHCEIQGCSIEDVAALVDYEEVTIQ